MGELNKNKENISAMFNNIAPKYDFLNHFLSAGTDKRWRKKVRKTLSKHKTDNILDIATGTGDLAIELSKLKTTSITGIDIAEKMIEIGNSKIQKAKLDDVIKLQIGDSLNIDFEDNKFDAVTCSFGVRNFQDLTKGLSEMHRVLKKDGKVVILEFSMPKNKFFAWIYKFYFRKILPFMGKIVSKDAGAYTYLPTSVETFPYGKQFLLELEKVGFKNATFKTLSIGIANLYITDKLNNLRLISFLPKIFIILLIGLKTSLLWKKH